MKKKYIIFGIILLFVLLSIGFGIVYLLNSKTDENISEEFALGKVDSYENIFVINISINPEIELFVDIDTGKVVSLVCKNEDAKELIEDINFNFLDTSYDEATEKFITACADKGYLNENNNDINVTVMKSDASIEIPVEYSEKIQNVCDEINNNTDFDIVTQINTGEYHNDPADLDVNFEEAFDENTDTYADDNPNSDTTAIDEKCPGCNGTGKCEECNGEGKFVCSVCGGKAGSPCTDCGGDGLIPCPECDGFGGCKACNKTGVAICDKCGGAGCDWCNKTGKMECKTCHGNALCDACEDNPGSGYHHCNACAGTGKTSCYRCNFLGYEICQGCNGDGLCPNCHGIKK